MKTNTNKKKTNNPKKHECAYCHGKYEAFEIRKGENGENICFECDKTFERCSDYNY